MWRKPKIGDYVIATKYKDGGIKDHWCIGFFSAILDYKTHKRYMIVDNDGKQFRNNGFRRIEMISPARANWLLKRKDLIYLSGKSIWWWYRQKITVKDDFDSYRKEQGMKKPEKIDCNKLRAMNCKGCPLKKPGLSSCSDKDYNAALEDVDAWLPDRDEIAEILDKSEDREDFLDAIAERLGTGKR